MGNLCEADGCDASESNKDVRERQQETFRNSVLQLSSKDIRFDSIEFYRKPINLKGIQKYAADYGIDFGATGADNPLHIIIVLRSNQIDYLTEFNSSGIVLKSITIAELDKELKRRQYMKKVVSHCSNKKDIDEKKNDGENNERDDEKNCNSSYIYNYNYNGSNLNYNSGASQLFTPPNGQEYNGYDNFSLIQFEQDNVCETDLIQFEIEGGISSKNISQWMDSQSTRVYATISNNCIDFAIDFAKYVGMNDNQVRPLMCDAIKLRKYILSPNFRLNKYDNENDGKKGECLIM